MGPPIDVVAGRYRLISLLGKGGMGSVWRGEHATLQTPVAIKLLEPRIASKETIRARFLREARAAASLRGKHVVQILDHGVEDGVPYIVMELLSGESLGARLLREPILKPRIVARILAEMAHAIARAHRAGVIHRDLKPDNVFLARQDEEAASAGDDGWVVKVVDFGIAKLVDQPLPDDVSTDTGAVLGTPHYMSPEQACGAKSLDARTDLWSMAVITFECLTGRRPFQGAALGELLVRICSTAAPVPSSVGPVPDGFDAWFARATDRAIDARFQNVADLVRSLEDVLTPGTHLFSVPTPSDLPSDPSARASQAELDSTVEADPPPGVRPAAADSSGSGAGPSRVEAQPASATEDPATRSVAPGRPRSARSVTVAIVALATVGAAIGLSWRSEPMAISPPSGRADASASAARPAPAAPTTSPTPIAAPTTDPPAPAPARPTEIVLTVRSSPPGAEVFRGAERLGRTGEPIRLPWAAAAFEVSVRLPGHRHRTVTIEPAPSVDVEVKLLPRPPSIETPF